AEAGGVEGRATVEERDTGEGGGGVGDGFSAPHAQAQVAARTTTPRRDIGGSRCIYHAVRARDGTGRVLLRCYSPTVRLFEGKLGLVLGIANKRSIAWGIARAVSREGARLAVTYQGERLEAHVRELAAERTDPLILPGAG